MSARHDTQMRSPRHYVTRLGGQPDASEHAYLIERGEDWAEADNFDAAVCAADTLEADEADATGGLDCQVPTRIIFRGFPRKGER